MVFEDEEEIELIEKLCHCDLLDSSNKNIDFEQVKIKNLEDIRMYLSQNFDKEAIASLCVYLHTSPNFSQDLKTLIMAYNGEVKFATAKNYAKKELEFDSEEFEA